MESLAKQLRTAGDFTRLEILCYIFDNKKSCVSDIAKELRVSIASVSHHLQALAREDLLKSNREGKKICYTLSRNDFMRDLKKFICKYK